MKLAYWIVIVNAGDEPLGMAAKDAADIRARFGDVALCAPTTRAALLRAGWTDETIVQPSERPSDFDRGGSVTDLRAIIRDRRAALGLSAGQLAAIIAPRWITARSPEGLDVRTAEQTLVHWLAGRKDQIPLPAIEAALDALRLRVIPYWQHAPFPSHTPCPQGVPAGCGGWPGASWTHAGVSEHAGQGGGFGHTHPSRRAARKSAARTGMLTRWWLGWLE